ncbi:RDD family protein [Falsibacillus albus]|uniref:RDD family protein n=1 Tax=Falsibacillus albus TaxID=2478915 RepID=A0A3L7K1Z2_9BACI|nr:RDD family protein [Falsibacillus albus]RLQ97078.1 RDD family protein [Falsibacillus albus]
MEAAENQEFSYEKKPAYAGFWVRFGAYVIDSLILGIPLGIINVLIVIMFFVPTGFFDAVNETGYGEPQLTNGQVVGMLATYAFLMILNLLCSIFYFAGFHASKYQATPGKLLLGLKVTDVAGNRISFWRALGRLLAMSFLSSILMIGYIIAAFTEKKQALHDLIAGTYVVRKL